MKAAAEALLRDRRSKDLTPAQAAIIAGAPQVAVELRPRPQRRSSECIDRGDDGEDACKESQLVVPTDATIVQRRNQILDLLAARPDAAVRATQYTPADFDGRQGRAGRPRAARATPRWIAPHFVWAVRDELDRPSCAATDAETCAGLERGGLDVTTTLDCGLQKIAEKWVKAAAIVPARQGPDARPPRRSASRTRAWMAQPARQGPAQRRARRRSTTRPASSSPTSGSADYYATSSTPEVPAPVRRRSATASASPARRSSRSTTRPASTTRRITAGIDAHGRRHRLRRRLHARPTPTTSSAARSASATPSSSRSTSRRSRRWPSTARPRLRRRPRRFGHAVPGRRDRRRPGPRAGRRRRSGPVDLVTRLRRRSPTAASSPTTRRSSTIKDARRQGRSSGPYTPPAGEQVVEPAGGLHRHRHPGRQHRTRSSQPVLGQVRDRPRPDRRRPGDAQDRHQQRRQGPQRLRLHRAADEGRAGRRRVRPRRRRLERQLRQHARVARRDRPLFSIDVSTYVWQGFLQEATEGLEHQRLPQARRARRRSKIDPWTGLAATRARPVRRRAVPRRDGAHGVRPAGLALRRGGAPGRRASRRTTTRG